MPSTFKSYIYAAAFGLAACFPIQATAQSNDSESGFCDALPVACLAGLAYVTWQLLLLSEPSDDVRASPVARGGYESPKPKSRDVDHSSDWGCLWGSRKYGTCH